LEETTNPRTHPFPQLKLKRRKKFLLKHMKCPIFGRHEGHLEETTNPRTHPLPHLKLKRRKKIPTQTHGMPNI